MNKELIELIADYCGKIVKTISRLITVLIDTGIIEKDQAVWILEPLNEKTESGDKK